MPELMLVNPRKRRRKRRVTRKRAVARRRPVRRRRYPTRKRRRRNPIARRDLVSTLMKTGQEGVIGSLGAIGGGMIAQYIPIPENLKMGNMGAIVNALIGIGGGMLVGKLMRKKRLGDQMAVGAVTVALHSTMKNMIQTALPNINLGGYAEDLIGQNEGLLGMGYYDGGLNPNTIGAYGMGYYDAAPVSNNPYAGGYDNVDDIPF